MVRLSTESTPRERLARIVVLMKRTRRYARGTIAIAAALVLASLLLALSTKRIYRSETTIVYREVVRAGREGESPAQRAARLGPRLKEIVLARGTLSSIIQEFDLYPELAEKSMLEAVAEMQKNVSFRARTQDTFALSFSHHDPAMAQAVTKRIAEVMIADYSKDNLTTAALNYDVLRRELDEANRTVEDASRALARFLAKHPQFTWGINDSPYAPTAPQPGAAAPFAQSNPANRAPQASRERAPADPVLARLLQRLAQIDAELAGPGKPGAPPPLPVNVSDAQKQRDAAAAALAAAETDLATKLQKVTPVHPDAISAQSKVARARAALATAEKTLDLLRTGGAPPPAVDAEGIDPGRRAALEEERRSIAAQISARNRTGASRGRGAATNPTPNTGTTTGTSVGTQAAPEVPSDPEIVELETEWHKLRLDLERARENFRKVQEKERGASLSATAAEEEAEAALVIADPAYLPVRPDRGRGRVFFAGSFVALFLALGYAGTRVLLCETILDEGDVEALGEPPLLVSVPHIPEPKTSTALTTRDSWGSPPPSSRRHEDTGPKSRPPDSGSIEVRMEAADAPLSDEPCVMPLGAPPSAPEVEEDPLPPKRIRMETLPYGATLADYLAKAQSEPPPIEEPPAEEPKDESIADDFADVPSADEEPTALSLRDPNAGAMMLAPEVEVVGTPFDPENEGALELVRGAPPAVLGALRVLRHRLEQRRGEGPLVVSVLSPGVGEGKSAVAARLAMTLAEAERARVVLVEGNLGRPRLASMLGLHVPEEMGFSAQLRRHMSGRWEPWSVLRIGASLYVLAEPATEAAFPTALHSTWFEGAVRALKESYDYVVIDGCAVLGSGDANVLEDVSDVCLLLARAGMTKGSELSRAAKQLGDRRMFGVVLNDVHVVGGAPKGRAIA
ncbi:CpsD/CapB family tyrosine-protein kinase [Polyangium sp. 15x6]|uniref:tyrosine-protein kinase domain-containing protein n=1 Tax=Polyangium sp. 15x6 TaxID=3042687 RepID=UPI00249BBE59|nr:CpsD/CapB family tyrosine-protein kinase [Polyangium sp. 15x6]MDI3284446.1 CpsD/CapB family tyrosine-protein kinase [Polyangium sp. 15x6]